MESTDQQLAKLSALNEQLENYFRNTIIPQLFVDANMILRKFTPPAMKQFRLKHTDIGKNIKDIKENFRFPTFIENIEHVIAYREILEKEVQTIDRRWYQMNIIPYITNKHRTDGVIVTFVDITSRINNLREQEQLVAEHELLLDTLAHDIKTPLTSLGMAIEVLKKLPEKGMDKFPLLLSNVDNSLIKMRSLIADLVDSRFSQGRLKVDEELLDLQNILEDVRLTLADQIEESQAEIGYDIKVTEITFARRKLRSIIYNLISNAIKYRDQARLLKIKVTSHEENGFVIISITDNGKGIAEHDQHTIFKKFKRLDQSIEGNGVGLYLASEILKSIGGKISVVSKVGKGSIFSIFIKSQ